MIEDRNRVRRGSVRRWIAGAAATALAAGALVVATTATPASAGTVSVHVSCDGWTYTEVAVSQGDTLEVTFDDNCLDSGTSQATAGTPKATLEYFSSLGDGTYPSGATITWVVAQDAPLGLLYPGTDLPYVCDGCSNRVNLQLNVSESEGPPAPPTNVVAVADGDAVDVSWTFAKSFPVPERFVVTADPGGATCEVEFPTMACRIEGLTPGETYTFSVVAVGEGGTSIPATSDPVTLSASGESTTTTTTVATGPGGAPAAVVTPSFTG